MQSKISERMKFIELYDKELKKCAIFMKDIKKEKLDENEKYKKIENKIVQEWGKYKEYERKHYKKLFSLMKKKNNIVSKII